MAKVKLTSKRGGLVNVDFSMFIDRKHVLNRLDKKERTVIARTGGYVRQVIRRSMRKGGKKAATKRSKPGDPPRYHTRMLRDKVFFGADVRNPKKAAEGVVGPTLYSHSSRVQLHDAKTGAEALEFGAKAAFRTRAGTVNTEIRQRPFAGQNAKVRRITREQLRKNMKSVKF